MAVDLHPPARERLRERGATNEEVSAMVQRRAILSLVWPRWRSEKFFIRQHLAEVVLANKVSRSLRCSAGKRLA
ncbi:MAG TPA: hypothetical protein VNP04_13130 [Alphaproteobacteria bacterium]|nr:hypothetical protein [Alphaproteobacteria bacterium]